MGGDPRARYRQDSGPGADDHVGDLDITLIGDETRDSVTLLDGWDAERGRIAPVIFGLEDGRLDPALDDRLEVSGTQILILITCSSPRGGRASAWGLCSPGQ